MQATIERIADELKAQDLAITADKERLASRNDIRNLNERLKLARSMKLKGQVVLFENAIKQRHRKWAIEHVNPYPEVTKDMARDAMCEPIKGDEEARRKSGLTYDQFDALRFALGDIQQMQRRLDAQVAQHAFSTYLARPGSWLELGGFVGTPSRQTHKYDLACEPLYVEGANDIRAEGSADTQVMLPMAALCELANAKNKDLFDSYQVWRPKEWKAPDPWLVGVYIKRDERGQAQGARFFKLCDWR